MTQRELPAWKQMVAGGAAGAASCLAGYPLDLVKTALQAKAPDLRQLMRERVLNIWRGSLFPLLVSAGSGAVYFMVLEQTRALLRRRAHTEQLTTRLEFAAGAISGFISGILPAFSEVVKINLQVNRTQYRNSMDFLRGMKGTEALPVFLRSFVLCTLIGTLGSGTFFSTYFYLYHHVLPHSPLIGLYCGAISGIVTWNVVFCLDTLKTVVISRGRDFSLGGTLAGLRQLRARDLAGIYLLGVVRGLVADSFSLLSYDLVTKALRGGAAK